MADCKNYREIISCYADGELSGNEKNRLERHLEECASCRSLLTFYKSIASAAEESLVEPPEKYTESIMDKIRELPEDSRTHISAAKSQKKALRPVIISFVAAAACLALVLMASPGLFGLTGGKSSTASVPRASASSAPAAYEAAAAPEAPADDMREYDSMKAAEEADDGSSAGVAGGINSAPASDAGDAETAPLPELGITAVSPTPMPVPSVEPQIQATGKGETDELRIYYAVFIIQGQLPDVIKDNARTDNSDGTFNIEISVETANSLIEDGFTADMGAPESDIALIKYTPQS